MGLNTSENLNDMLREYAPHKIIKDEVKKSNYFWNKVKKDPKWKDGTEYQVPMKVAQASSFNFGGLVASNDIGESKYTKPVENNHAQLFGALKFNDRDLKRYDGDLKKSFLKVLPGAIEDFSERMTFLTSIALLNGGSLAAATANSTADGVMTVDHPERFELGQKIVICTTEGAVSDVEGYVDNINMSEKQLLVKDARTAGSTIDLSAFDVTNGTVTIKIPGYATEQFYSLQDHILPVSQGGKNTIHGIDKTDYPILQSQVVDGSGWTAANILTNLYDFYFNVKTLGKVKTPEILCPYSVLKAALVKLDGSKRFVAGDRTAGVGYSSVELLGPDGTMRLTGVADLNDSQLFCVDWRNLEFAGDEFFNMQRHGGNGDLYYTERLTTGYTHIVDIALSGQLMCLKNSGNGAVHSISL